MVPDLTIATGVIISPINSFFIRLTNQKYWTIWLRHFRIKLGMCFGFHPLPGWPPAVKKIPRLTQTIEFSGKIFRRTGVENNTIVFARYGVFGDVLVCPFLITDHAPKIWEQNKSHPFAHQFRNSWFRKIFPTEIHSFLVLISLTPSTFNDFIRANLFHVLCNTQYIAPKFPYNSSTTKVSIILFSIACILEKFVSFHLSISWLQVYYGQCKLHLKQGYFKCGTSVIKTLQHKITNIVIISKNHFLC